MKTRLDEIWDRAREVMAPKCRVCPVCDGKACRGEIPGMGGMGDGSSWTACADFLKSVRLNMDTLYEYKGVDAGLELLGRSFKYPLVPGPIGGMAFNYNNYMSDDDYNMAIVRGSRQAGILPFTGGDERSGRLFGLGLRATRAVDGVNVVTMKPFDNDILLDRIEKLKEAGAIAFAMDIDAAGFVNMGGQAAQVQPKSVARLRELTDAGLPFILKGVLTVKGAVKAAEAGCYGIVVSSHGGRVITSAPSTCAVLPEIRAAVGDGLKIFVDGGIRSGMDVFKAIALGADAAMIGRPYGVAAHGGGAEGVALYSEKIGAELIHTMLMCGASSLGEISRDMVRI